MDSVKHTPCNGLGLIRPFISKESKGLERSFPQSRKDVRGTDSIQLRQWQGETRRIASRGFQARKYTGCSLEGNAQQWTDVQANAQLSNDAMSFSGVTSKVQYSIATVYTRCRIYESDAAIALPKPAPELPKECPYSAWKLVSHGMERLIWGTLATPIASEFPAARCAGLLWVWFIARFFLLKPATFAAGAIAALLQRVTRRLWKGKCELSSVTK